MMEEEVGSPIPAKRTKLSGGGGFKIQSGKGEDQVFEVKQGQNVPVLESPTMEPMLLPEIWAQIFEYLPPDDLITVINTCPEWRKLLEAKRKSVLFPQLLEHCSRGFLSIETLKVCRQLNKTCKEAVDLAIPEIALIIRIQEETASQMREFEAYIQVLEMRLMRRLAINIERHGHDFPEEIFREGDEEEEEQPDQENEFNNEQICENILR
ncbi:unnamed protein product [Orchesella dallaii]|uniref:F-box domain-containing protein n=2 Tax=Orchesella dallaii TaxID=48710 RepID=A0ABP1PKI7_9HEXA